MTMFIFTRFIALPLLLVIGGVWVDLRTRRGYGLTLLAVALLALSVWSFFAWRQALQQTPASESLAAGMVLAIYLLIVLAYEAMLWIGALVESSVARQGWWIAGLVASAVLPGLLILADILLGGVSGYAILRDIEAALIIISPTLAVLAYGIRRSIRPARQLAGSSRP